MEGMHRSLHRVTHSMRINDYLSAFSHGCLDSCTRPQGRYLGLARHHLATRSTLQASGRSFYGLMMEFGETVVRISPEGSEGFPVRQKDPIVDVYSRPIFVSPFEPSDCQYTSATFRSLTLTYRPPSARSGPWLAWLGMGVNSNPVMALSYFTHPSDPLDRPKSPCTMN